MTSTYPASRSSSHNDIKNGLKEAQSKKEALLSLESALKKRINEFRELCLKEGELTGQLPIDYPLQPREPIPQIRRRTHQNNDNLNGAKISVAPPFSMRHRQLNQDQQALNFPSRPMSTNSTSSSLSTASSNNKNAQQNSNNYTASAACSSRSSSNNGFHIHQNHTNYQNSRLQCNTSINNNGTQPIRYDQSMLPSQFKRPLNLPMTSANFDSDTLGSTRASSTASSSSSFGSGASSTLSAPVMPSTGYNNSNGLDSMNLHGRSQSESLSINDAAPFRQTHGISIGRHRETHQNGGHIYDEPNANLGQPSGPPPPRPPRGLTHNRNQLHSSLDTVDGVLKARQRQLAATVTENKISESIDGAHHHKLQEGIAVKPSTQNQLRTNEIKSIQPFYEETKPFQMADFYKYSSKHRQSKISDHQKTTHQLQQEALRKNNSYAKYSYDDHSVKLIERNGQELMQATARAIAANPGLAGQILDNLEKCASSESNKY